ncbi:MAG: hypothetical protein E7333_04130 [Clostridiales bacterium]|nr:hypothetical protein [Clostridiales bacterium]
MRRKNLLVILLVVVVIIAVAVAALLMGHRPVTLPEGTQEEIAAANGYVYILAGEEARWIPLPDEPYNIRLTMTDAQGEQTVNVITLTKDSAVMSYSTCDNQDCVQQGVVTLDNKGTRPLGNMIICLPQNVGVELYSTQEVLDMLSEQAN